MIIEKSKELLEKLRRTNYKRIPDFGMDEESDFCGFKWKNIKSTIKYDDNSERNVNRSTKREKIMNL